MKTSLSICLFLSLKPFQVALKTVWRFGKGLKTGPFQSNINSSSTMTELSEEQVFSLTISKYPKLKKVGTHVPSNLPFRCLLNWHRYAISHQLGDLIEREEPWLILINCPPVYPKANHHFWFHSFSIWWHQHMRLSGCLIGRAGGGVWAQVHWQGEGLCPGASAVLCSYK